MRRIVLLITICCQVFWVAAQKKAPKWMDKQRKAVVTVTTYGKDNQKKASGTGYSFPSASVTVALAASLNKE